MSVVTCRECGFEFDDTTRVCPRCGCPAHENEVQCEECDVVYDAQLEACPVCGCPNVSREISVEKHDLGDDNDFALSLVRTLKRVFTKCDDFSGRSRRSEFWTFVLFNCALGFILYLVLFGSIGRDYIFISDAATRGEYWSRLLQSCLSRHLFVSIVIVVCVLLMALPSVSVAVRRLHDVNRSGWWIMLGVVPFILGLVFDFSPYIGVLLLSLLLLLDSVGDNRWGKKPSR